ncbi:MAG: AraC family transcriptional regulator ligand-binding domain-containing protein [Pseudomonadota bacterium]
MQGEPGPEREIVRGAEARRVSGVWPRRVAALMPEAAEAARRAARIPAEVFEPDSRKDVSLRQQADFFDALAREAGDPWLGLRLGARWDPKGATLASYILLAARDLRDALESARRYARVDRAHAEPRLEVSGGRATIMLDAPDPYERLKWQAPEFRTAGALRYLEAAVARPLPLIGIAFSHPRPGDVSEAERLLGCPVRFGARRMAIVFEAEALDWPVPTQDDALCALLKDYGDMVLAQRRDARPLFAQEVERRYLERLPYGGATAEELARAMGCSTRSFQRRLAEAGLTLRALGEELRQDLALRYLEEPSFSVAEVGCLLGYAGPSAFTAAFRRWTGETPREWRRRREAEVETA